MKIKHSDHVATVVEKCAQNMEDMRTNMQSQHLNEMETMKANHDKEINFVQRKLLALEENMTIMEFNHSNHVTAIETSYQEEDLVLGGKRTDDG